MTTSLDVNTDSNTRQRDNCEMDAFIAAMGQFSISASVQLQRRTFEFAMRNGYNMQCALTPPSALSLLIAVVCECRLFIVCDCRGG